MARIRLKACPACSGDLYWVNAGWASRAEYRDNWVWVCLACSREAAVDKCGGEQELRLVKSRDA